MDGINIDDLTIEQYLRLTQENQTPSMVKKVDDMTISEYIEYVERMKRQYNRNYGSYFPTYSGHCTSSNNTTIEFPHDAYPIQTNTEFNYDSEYMELNEESFEEELSSKEDLDEWLKSKMEKHMSKQNEKNEEDALIAIIKFIKEEYTINNDSFLPYQPSLEELNPGSFLLPFTIDNYNSYFIANIDASNNVMPRSIYEYLKLGTVKDVLVKIDKFEFSYDFVVADMPENLGEIIILGIPFLETIHAQIDVFQEEISLGIGEDRIKFDVNRNPRQSDITIDKVYMTNTGQEEEYFNPLEIRHDLFSYESPACLKFEHDTRNYDTIDPQNEITGQTNPLLDKRRLTKRWHVQVFYDDRSGKDCGMWPTCDPNSSFYNGYKEIGEKANISESPKLRPFRPRPCDYSFDEWLKVKIGHTNIYDSDREIISNEWILDNFDVEGEYAKEIGNLYSRRFDEYKRVFDNEVENLSNEYTLRVGKKGYVMDDVWKKCEQYHRKIINSWHDIGFEEEKLWRSGDEKTDYEPPFVDIKTFEVNKYSFKRRQSFICITKQDDDALPLG
ncbi:reverse transcriptase domain-containing protein [Tanacetum coccineum]